MHCSMAHLASVPTTTLSGLPRYHVCGVTIPIWQWELWKGLLGVASECMGVGQMRLANTNRKKKRTETRSLWHTKQQMTSFWQFPVDNGTLGPIRQIWVEPFESIASEIAIGIIIVIEISSRTSTKWLFVHWNLDQMGIWKCWFLRRQENRSTRRKTSQSRGDNQQQTQPTYCVESENRSRATSVGGECSHHCAIPAVQVTPNEVSRQRRMRINVT